MANTVNLGSLNFPKLMRHVGHRTNQVRDLVFMRDAIFNKETKTTKSGGNLTGPAVNFGYESNLNTNVSSDTTDSLYHVVTPELTLTGLKAVQTPIISRSGELERTGHRITGSCTFYMPSLSYIRALPEFSTTTQFDELETYDKLIDMERIIQNPSDVTGTNDQTIDLSPGSTYPAGYEIDRIQFKIKITSDTLTSITLNGEVGGTGKALTWTATDTFRTQDSDFSETFITIDLPVRDIESGSTKKVQQGGGGRTFTASTVTLDVDKLIGDDSNYLSSLVIATSGSNSVELKDIYLYKEAEWRVETIKDYRDEYMEVGAVRVRGDRTSRRRAYG
jgi:hypothetical protein